MIKSLISAIGFLTIIPTPKKYSGEFKHSVIFFPIVGLIIGGIIITVKTFGAPIFPEAVLNLFIVFTFIIVTGGLHLDGLADTVDGFYAGRKKEDILRIMDDPHIGAMGVIAIVFSLMTRYLAVLSIPKNILISGLILSPVAGRWAMVLLMKISKPAKEDGLGNFFMKNIMNTDFIISGILSILIMFFLFGLKGILIFSAVSLIVLTFSKYYNRKIGGITGDNLGAISEITELAALIFLSMKI